MTDFGDCGVCGIGLHTNHAHTVCRHSFCISCLLKWHKANPNATCPLCRTPFYEDEDEDEDYMEDEDEVETSIIIEEMDFNMDEEIMHDHMMEVVEHCAMNHCQTNPSFSYTGHINLRIVPNEDGSNYRYERIDVGTPNPNPNPNSYYIVELFDTARAFRYRFGRIEEIVTHHLYHGVKLYAFRERIDHVDEEQAQIITEWADEIQHIAIDQVKVLRQYLPKFRMQA